MMRARQSLSSRIRGVAALGVLSCVLLAGCGELGASRAATSETPTAAEESASAAPVTVEELGSGDRGEVVDVEVEGPVTVTYRRITIAPGAGTGLHCHHGQLVAIVEEGELTHRAPVYPGGEHVYQAGDSLVEGAGYVHEGINERTEDLVLLVTYITETGKPLAETDLELCDA